MRVLKKKTGVSSFASNKTQQNLISKKIIFQKFLKI